MTELLNLLGDLGAGSRAEYEALQHEIGALRRDSRTEFAEVKHEIAALKTRLADFKTAARTKIAGVQSELIKWTFLFWLGTIGIVVLSMRLPT